MNNYKGFGFSLVAIYHLLAALTGFGYAIYSMLYDIGGIIRLQPRYVSCGLFIISSIFLFIGAYSLLTKRPGAIRFNYILLISQSIIIVGFGCIYAFSPFTIFTTGYSTAIDFTFEFEIGNFIMIYYSELLTGYFFFSLNPIPIIIMFVFHRNVIANKKKAPILEHKIGTLPTNEQLKQRTEDMYN